MNDLFKKDKLIWEAQIRKIEIMYEEIVHIKLPEYQIKFIENIKDINYSMQILNSTKPMTLNINIGFMLNKSFDYASILFHEFTHLCDYSFLALDKDERYRKTALLLFSELHAEYIRGMYLYSISNVKNNNQTIYSNLEDSVMKNIFLIEESIVNYNKENSVTKFYNILKTYMYYYGSLIAYNQFANKNTKVKMFNFKYDDLIRNFYKIAEFKQFDDKMLEISYKLKIILDENLKNDIIG